MSVLNCLVRAGRLGGNIEQDRITARLEGHSLANTDVREGIAYRVVETVRAKWAVLVVRVLTRGEAGRLQLQYER